MPCFPYCLELFLERSATTRTRLLIIVVVAFTNMLSLGNARLVNAQSLPVNPLPVGEDRPSSADEKVVGQENDAADKLMRIFDAILENHIESPTRQQLVLDTIVDLQAAIPNFNRQSWVARVSATSERDELLRIIRDVFSQSHLDTEIDRLPVLSNLSVTPQPITEAKVAEQIAANRYVGIGVAVSKTDDQPARFVQIVPGGTAESAGVLPGDQLLEANGQPMDKMPLADIIACLRGPEGSELTIKIRSADGMDVREITMVRRVVPFKTVIGPAMSKSRKSAMITLQSITASSVHELRQSAAKLDDEVELVTIACKQQSEAVDLHHATLLASGLLGDTHVGSVVRSDGTKQDVRLNGEKIFGNRKIKLLVDSSSVGAWVWIAAASSSDTIPSGTSTAKVAEERFSTAARDELSSQKMNEYSELFLPSSARHFETILLRDVDLAVTMPVGFFCDPAGKTLRTHGRMYGTGNSLMTSPTPVKVNRS